MPVLSFKVTPEQARELRRSAKLKKMTVSDYLRHAAFPPPAKKRAPKDDIRPGRVIIATPPLTKEMIDSALYD